MEQRVSDEWLAELAQAYRNDKGKDVACDLITDLQDARAELNEAIEVIKGMVLRSDSMNKSADDHPEREMAAHRAIGGERVAHSGRDYLERIGVES